MSKNVEPIYETTFRQRNFRRGKIVGGIIFLVLLVTLGWWFIQDRQNQQLSHYPVKGVSLSQDDGYIDFHSLQKTGLQFAYLRASSGASYIDDRFANFYGQAQGTDLKIGVYHMYSFSSSAQSQYTNFKQAVKNDDGQLPIAIQIAFYDSYSAKTINVASQQAKLKKLVHLIETHYQRPVIIWASNSVWNQFVKGSLPKQQRWVANGELKRHGSQVAFVEYDPDAKIKLSGSSQTVSRSVYTGNKRQWQTYLNQLSN